MQKPVVFNPEVRSLQRSFLRQIKQLPTNYLRQFFRIKVGDDLRTLSNPGAPSYKSKLKRVAKELRKLTDANNGDTKAFQHVLGTAYGRKGKLRWELMEPLLSDPSVPLPDPIIPSIEKSRPPVFSPELTALLTSSYSRPKRPLTTEMLNRPPSLPERVDPDSEEARLLGPFSKRRQVNIRWRFFTEEWKKVLPPLHVTVEKKTERYETVDISHHNASLALARIRGFGFQHTDVLEEINAVAGPPYKPRSLSSATSVGSTTDDHSPSNPSGSIANRFIRRRYQELLGKIPILTYSYRMIDDKATPLGYEVSLAPNAISSKFPSNPSRIPDADKSDLEWIDFANTIKDKDRSKRTSRICT